MTIKDGLVAITNEVLDDIQKEAQTIISAAESEAKKTLKAAKAQSDQNYRNILTEANTKSEGERRKIASATDMEIRNSLLQKKEELMDTVFEKTFAKLQKFAETEEYHDYLLGLIEQAAKRMNKKNLLVQVNARDKNWLTQGTLNSLSKKLKFQLTLSNETEEFVGGCKVIAEDGKITYDCSIDNRLQELKPALRIEVAKILFIKEA